MRVNIFIFIYDEHTTCISNRWLYSDGICITPDPYLSFIGVIGMKQINSILIEP